MSLARELTRRVILLVGFSLATLWLASHPAVLGDGGESHPGSPGPGREVHQLTDRTSCVEDDPCWDCATMGNHVCGKGPEELSK